MEEMTLTGLLIEAAGEFPSRRAFSVPSKLDLTHARLRDLINSVAAHLASCGVRHADVIALTFPNTIEFVIMFLAVIQARAVAAPLNPAYTQEEFEFYLSDSESKVLITNSEGNVAAVAATAKLQIPHATATLSDPVGRVQISLPRRSDSALTSANVPSNVA